MLGFGSIFLLCCIRGIESLCDEAAKQLDRLDTRSINYTAITDAYGDNYLVEGWYSVVKDGVQYLMTDKMNYFPSPACGTYYPVGLAGTHPLISEITEQPVVISAYTYWYWSWNWWYWYYSYPVKVRKCHGKIQYYLYPACSNCGYCFEPSSSSVNTVVVDGIKPELQFRRNGNAASQLDIIPYVVFRCSYQNISGRMYNVTWELEGIPLVSFGSSDNQDDHLLTEDTLLNHTSGSNLHGQKLTCVVSLLALNETSNETDGGYYTAESTPLTLAAEVKTNPIYVYKNQRAASIEIEFYLPVGCGYSIIQNEKPSFPCEYSLKLYMQDEWSCSRGGIANIVTHTFPNRYCTNPLHLLESSDKWNGSKIVHSLDFTTIDRNYDDATEFFLELKFDDKIGHRLWKNYTFPMIQVKVVTEGIYRNKVCYSHNDPHMRSADQNYYEQHQTGIFTMYLNDEYKIEVQAQVKPCYSGSYVRCACGVAVRAGGDVFLINQCGSINYMDFPHCGDGGILTVIQLSSRHVQVITPIGTRIDVDFHWERFMNIDIYMSPKDEGNIVGLCGKFDDVGNNDFLQKDGTTLPASSGWYYEPANFSKSWMVLEENSYFQSEMQLDLWSDINKSFCLCQRPGTSFWESLCSSTQDFGCSDSNSLTDKKCQLSNRRKRTLSRQHEKEKIRLFSLMKEDVPERKRMKRNIQQNITAEEAEQICGAINDSLSVTDYADVLASEDPVAVTSQCKIDVMEMNDASMVDLHIEAMITLVKNIIDLTPSYAANNSEKVEYFLTNSCPRNCSGNGVCTVNGTCECKESFQGDDCSINPSDPLVIDDIEGGGSCDVFDNDCRCFVIRTDNLLNGFSCNISVYEVTNTMNHSKVWDGSAVGEYLDIFTGVCCVNEEHTKNQSTAYAMKYEFSISNNDANYGPAVNTYIYNSECQDVQSSVDSNTVVVVLGDFCFIDSYCVEKNMASHNSCFVCIPQKNLYNWTYVCDEDAVDDKKSVVVVVVALSATAAGLFIIVTLACVAWKFLFKKKEKVVPNGENTGPNYRSKDVKYSSSRIAFFNQPPTKEFTQPEKNPFGFDNARPYFRRAVTNQGPSWPEFETDRTTSAKAEDFQIVKQSNEIPNILQNYQLERQDTQGPNFEPETPRERVESRGISVIDFDFNE